MSIKTFILGAATLVSLALPGAVSAQRYGGGYVAPIGYDRHYDDRRSFRDDRRDYRNDRRHRWQERRQWRELQRRREWQRRHHRDGRGYGDRYSRY